MYNVDIPREHIANLPDLSLLLISISHVLIGLKQRLPENLSLPPQLRRGELPSSQSAINSCDLIVALTI